MVGGLDDFGDHLADSDSKGNEGNWAASGDKLTYITRLALGNQQLVKTPLVSVF